MSGILKKGARFALKRRALTEGAVTYLAAIELPEGRGFERVVTVDRASGAVAQAGFEPVGGASGEPEPWMVDFLDTLLRQMVRSGLKDDLWPRKLRRWKDAPP